MLSHPRNRVQAIKSKFENLSSETEPTKQLSSLYKLRNECERKENKENSCQIGEYTNKATESDSSSDDSAVKPKASALYKIEVKRSVSDSKTSLSRQSSDPGKKLHRSHAFRCDRSQKINSPRRHGSCNGRSETSEYLKMERKLSKDRLKKLGNVLEQQMKKENFVPYTETIVGEVKLSPLDSIPDEKVPPHILAQYAKVIKPKKDDKQEIMTDSGVSSETENLDDDKSGRVRKITSQFESIEKTDLEPIEINKNEAKPVEIKTNLDLMNSKNEVKPVEIKTNLDLMNSKNEVKPVEIKTNLDLMEDLAGSSETMKLERKNPHLILTDTLKKALKQPLPPGPPPKKPPRIFTAQEIEKEKNDAKRKLEKLEQVLLKRDTKKDKNIYDIAEENLSLKRPKEIHYLCTEILDITQRTLLPSQNDSSLKNCFNKLNCSVTNNSMLSLPYTRLSSGFHSNRNSKFCSCSQDNLNSPLLTFMSEKCMKCHANAEKHGFKCHMACKCKVEKSEFFVDEHIYDEPCISNDRIVSENKYGTLNNGAFSKSLEDLREKEDTPVYDTPCDLHPTTLPPAKTEFQKLRENFENGAMKNKTGKPEDNSINNRIGYKMDKREKTLDSDLSPNKIEFKIERLLDNANQNRFDSKIETILENTSFPNVIESKIDRPGKLKLKPAKSSENVFEDGKFKKKSPERRFATELRRYRPRETGLSLQKKTPQLDVDKENLNRLMNEIYETVTAACNMQENKPGSFPTESDGGASEESVKLTRSLTEKRKNYVRRVSSRLAYLEPKNIRTTRVRHQTSICSYKSDIHNPYSTFRSWKSFRASQNNLTRDKMDSDSKFNLTDSSGNILSMKFDLSIGSIDNISIDEKTGCVDIELPFEARENGLFNVCLLVGLNHMTREAYVKSVFPSQVQVPQHIENLIFPETLSPEKGEWAADAKSTQCYSFVLTDERGERSYGYCRRVLPEGATSCLPLCYCLIGKYRAPGFYYKVLKELESHHGSSDGQINSILQQLFEMDFPSPGEELTLTYTIDIKTHTSLTDLSLKSDSQNMTNSELQKVDLPNLKVDLPNIKVDLQNSADSEKNSHPQIVKCNVLDKSMTMPDLRRSDGGEYTDLNTDYYDYENNNGPMRVTLSLDGTRMISLKRPLEPRAEETSAAELLDSLGAGLLIKVFGSLLLERKLIIRASRLSAVSSQLEALQASLYPFVWQQPLISAVPAEIQHELLHAPVPMLAGMLGSSEMDLSGVVFEEGMFIDLSHPSKVLFYQGDESTILPTTSYKTLKTSLQMESNKNKDKEDDKTRNVMISEAFLRFFVDVLGDFWKHFNFGVMKDGDLGRGDVVFDKEAFIKSAPSKQNQYFLEWFTETAMFNHFIQNMAVRYKETHSQDSPTEKTNSPDSPDVKSNSSYLKCDSISYRSQMSISDSYKLIDAPTPNFYQLFEERVLSRRNSKGVDRSYRNALNKRVKLLKSRLKELVG